MSCMIRANAVGASQLTLNVKDLGVRRVLLSGFKSFLDRVPKSTTPPLDSAGSHAAGAKLARRATSRVRPAATASNRPEVSQVMASRTCIACS
ncbi:hypothetical protein D3C76_1457290 [compost metagenome]